jgi:hypothetical protein
MPSYQNEHKWWNSSYHQWSLSRKDVIETLGERFPFEDREKNWAKHYLEIVLEMQKNAPTKEGL